MLKFWLCFVSIFIAVDAIGILPMFMGFTEGIEKARIKWVIIQSIITAMIVALVFLVVGNYLILMLGITIPDFMIAGGLLLFIISLNDMLAVEKKQRVVDIDSLGAVPIGVPLLVGPAVLTTTILMIQQYGSILTVFSIVINILIAGIVFFLANPIYKILGKAGSKTVSKLANLLLAAIAVMMIRKGVIIIIKDFIK
jgi:multiple antibiotic resistance protein